MNMCCCEGDVPSPEAVSPFSGRLLCRERHAARTDTKPQNMTEIFTPTFTTSSLSFSGVPHTASEHFKLYFYAAVLRILSRLSLSLDPADQRPPDEILFSQFPFLGGYNDELAAYGLAGMALEEAQYAWQAALDEWERNAAHSLPIIELRSIFGLEYSDLTLLAAIGLIEEDARFGRMYASVQGDPDLTLPTHELDVNICVDRIMDLLRQRKILR